MYNSKPKSADKPEKIKKTFAFRPEVAELIETHKYVHRGREEQKKILEQHLLERAKLEINILILHLLQKKKATSKSLHYS